MQASSPQPLTSQAVCETPQGKATLRRGLALQLSLLACCAILPYVNTLFNGFVYDDTIQVLANPYVQSFRYLRQIFTTGVWSFNGPNATNYYRPLMSLGYLLCYELFGRSAYGFHLFNILLHVLVVGVLFLLTERLFSDSRLAFWTAIIFALHPIHTESVAWIGGVTDLELTFFYLITFLLFSQAGRAGGKHSRKWQAAMLASFALTAISKEQALTLPLLAVVYEHFFREDRKETTWRQKLSRYDVLWVASAVYLLVRIRLLGAFAPVSQIGYPSPRQILLSAVALFGKYMGKLFYPAHLCAFYIFHLSQDFLEWHVLAGLLAMGACAGLLIFARKRAPSVSFGLVWLVVTLLPVLNPKWVGQNVFAERYLYLPSVGFCWVTAWAGLRLWRAMGNYPGAYRKAFASALVVVAALCCARIVTRNQDWHDDLTLYTRTLAVSPEAYVLRNNLGDVYDGMGDEAGAEREWLRVLKTNPDYSITLGNLGMMYSRHHLYSLAVNYLQRAIKANRGVPDNYIKLGFTYANMGELDEAEAQFRSAEAIAPYNPRPLIGMAYVYEHRGDDRKTEEALKKAESLSPSESHVHATLGDFYVKKHRISEAREEYLRAIQLDSTDTQAVEGLRTLPPLQ